MKELVKIMATAIVDNPDAVNVTEIAGNSARVLELQVAKADLGKIIGKKGRNANALRHILNAASFKTKQRIVLEIIE